MISKKILRKRLSVALGKQLKPADFTWFFGYFCEKSGCMRLRTAKELSYEDVRKFSQFCGYDLNFPIPLPLWVQI